LHRICSDVRFLGSYPRADGKTPRLRLGVADDNFAEAQRWLDGIRGHDQPSATPIGSADLG
jgi:prephenate dehydratase